MAATFEPPLRYFRASNQPVFACKQLSQIHIFIQINCWNLLLITHIKYMSTIYSEEFTLILFNVFICKLDFSCCYFGPFWIGMPYFRFGHSYRKRRFRGRAVSDFLAGRWRGLRRVKRSKSTATAQT